MRLVLPLALGLSACGPIVDQQSLSAEQTACVATNAALAYRDLDSSFYDLSYAQRGVWLAQASAGVADLCAVRLTPMAEALIESALLVATK